MLLASVAAISIHVTTHLSTAVWYIIAKISWVTAHSALGDFSTPASSNWGVLALRIAHWTLPYPLACESCLSPDFNTAHVPHAVASIACPYSRSSVSLYLIGAYRAFVSLSSISLLLHRNRDASLVGSDFVNNAISKARIIVPCKC
jgi:hypothetical protein